MGNSGLQVTLHNLTCNACFICPETVLEQQQQMAKRKETQQKTDTKKPKQIAKNKPASKTQKNKGICIEIYLRSIKMYLGSKLFAE